MLNTIFKPWFNSVNSVARFMATTYTNNTGRNMIVIIFFTSSVTLAGGYAHLDGYVNGVSQGSMGLDNAAIMGMYCQMVLFVPPGGTYRFDQDVANGTITLGNRFEVY